MPLRVSNDSLPKIAIELDNGLQGPFYPGSRVSGQVVLMNHVGESPVSIEVSLVGRSEAYAQRNDSMDVPGGRLSIIHHRDQTLLFSTSTLVLETSLILPGQHRHAWGFAFHFPSMTQSNCHVSYDSASSEIWTTGVHALPPSFSWIAPNTSAFAAICYTVEAVLRQSQPAESIQARVPLHFTPFRGDPGPVVPSVFREDFRIASTRLEAANQGQTPRVKRALTSWISKTSPDDVSFCFKASVPSHITTGEAFTVLTEIDFGDQPASTYVASSVHFKVSKLKLLHFVVFRARRDPPVPATRFKTYKNEEIRTYEGSFDLALLPSSAVRTPEKGHSTVPFSFQAVVPALACPSFRSFAINRSYRLKLSISVELGGRDFKLQFEVPNVTVLSAIVDTSELEAQPSIFEKRT